MHSSLVGKTVAQREALCTATPTLLGCTKILADKKTREDSAEMAKLKMPFGGKLSSTKTPIDGGSPTTVMEGSAAIRQAGLEAKPSLTIKDDGSKETNKYSAGAIFLSSTTGTGGTNAMAYGVHAGNVDRRPGGLARTEEENRYNIATKFTPTPSGNYSIEVFHVRKSGGALTRLSHDAGNIDHRNAALDTNINPAVSNQGTVTSLGKLSSTGKDAYMEIGSLDLKKELMPDDDKMFDGWNYKILSGNVNAKPASDQKGSFYAEVWDNYGVSKSDYMVGGVWLFMPEDAKSTRFAAFAQTNSSYDQAALGNGLKRNIIGTATYNGLAAGFYVDNMNQVHRLLGKIQMDADFGNVNSLGTLGGSISGITLNGKESNSILVLSSQDIRDTEQIISASWTSKASTVSGAINGKTVMGDWSAIFTGPASPADDAKPTGVIGTASGYSADEKHAFAVSFGAKPPATE